MSKLIIIAYVKVPEGGAPSNVFLKENIVGFYSKSKLMTRKPENAFVCEVDGPTIPAQTDATSLLAGPHPFDHLGQIFTALVEIEVDRSHEECCDCTKIYTEPPQCIGHPEGPVPCPNFHHHNRS